MAMVEVPGGSAVGGRSNHGRRTTPFFLEGRLEKAEGRAGSGKKQVPTDDQAPSLYHSFLKINLVTRNKLVIDIKGGVADCRISKIKFHSLLVKSKVLNSRRCVT
eukprot:scaffold97367_cov88-Cyclotella_meneghiniana.AAC.1